MQTSIETIYQKHIKPLSQADRIKLLAKMADDLANGKEKNRVSKKKCSIMELRGLGKEIWEEIDVQEYVDELRDEWGHRT